MLVGTGPGDDVAVDPLTNAGYIELGPRVALALGIPALALAALVLIGVHPRRDPRQAETA